MKGAALASLGRLREGVAVIRAGEELARESGLTSLQLRALLVRTYFEQETDLTGSLAGMREGLALARKVGDRLAMLRFMNNVGYTAFVVGDWDGGLAVLEDGLAEDLDRPDRIVILSNALIIRACRGESVADGLAELERATEGETDIGLRAAVDDLRANAALAQGQLGDARPRGCAWWPPSFR